jgi:hypothetical protein
VNGAPRELVLHRVLEQEIASPRLRDVITLDRNGTILEDRVIAEDIALQDIKLCL